MMASQIRSYRFSAAQHWHKCLLHRWDTSAAALVQTSRLGARAKQLQNGGEVSAVAAGRPAVLMWRVHTAGPSGRSAGARWLDENDAPAGPVEIDATLAHSTRWIIDRAWLWAFDRTAARVRRYDRETLQLDLTSDIANTALGSSDHTVAQILDITSDARQGLWVLVQSSQGRTWLVHLDCEGCARKYIETPCAAGPVRQLGSVDGGNTLVLLTADGRHLWFVATTDGAARYSRSVTDLANCWTAERLATDARNRVALGVRQHGRWALLLLDAAGNALEAPITTLFEHANRHQRRDSTDSAAARDDESGQRTVDLALSGDKVWIARRDGLWSVDSTAECEPGESRSVLLTPALLSPQVDTSKGWLRAEVSLTLPRGAVLSAEYASTNDERVADRLTAIAASSTMSVRSKQRAIWDALVPRPTTLSVTGTGESGAVVAIPLFETDDRWIWLRLTIVTPPDAGSASLSTLRVLYPNLSLVDHLPAVFRGLDGDVGHTLRRLVGALETTTQSIDEKIRSIAVSLNADTARNDWLDYVARWLALPWDNALPEASKRCILKNAAVLLGWRGTRRGLDSLVRCLVGNGRFTLTDFTVDYAAIRLGGDTYLGASLPGIIAGASPRTATLSGKAVLGRACVGKASTRCDSIAAIVPTVSIRITTDRAQSRETKGVIQDVIAQYLPIGVQLALAWRLGAEMPRGDDAGDVLVVLDAIGPGALGGDSVVGRTILTGRSRPVIDDAGLELGFHL